MSFRSRLTLFFLLIVVVPMVALGVVVARLVSDSEQGKTSARSDASATALAHSYRWIAARGERAARTLGADPALADALRRGDAAAATARARRLAQQLGLVRVTIVRAAAPLVSLGDPHAVAAGIARVRASSGPTLLVEASTITATQLVRLATSPGVHVAIARAGVPLASTIAAGARRPPGSTASFRAADFGGALDTVTVLADARGPSGAIARGRWIALVLLAGFLVLAFIGALGISRQLHGQLARFLAAARRIGQGDFSTTVPVEGGDEFGQLGREFNRMSRELEQRLAQLDREQTRLRESIQRIGATFAANLDRFALLELGTQTAVDAVEADCGRATVAATPGGDLLECARVGDLAAVEHAIEHVEAQVRVHGVAAAATIEDVSALAAPIERAGSSHGIVAVARTHPFSAEEVELVASLARQTGVSLENVELHDEVQRQAVTDELTGLANHGRFQQVMAAETAVARRFGQSLGLVLLDVDDFKRVNDTYGHPQGDLVLREVANAVRACAREIDEPARYGGEEIAVALPQTDLDGAEAIAERMRIAIASLVVPRLDGGGVLRVTVSCGVAASTAGDREALVAAADAALYRAKHAGKNRTMRAVDPIAVRPGQ